MPSEVLGEIWGVAATVGPVDVRVFTRGISGYPVQLSNTPERIVPAGVPLSSLTIQNLGAVAIEIGNDRGLTYGTGLRIPPNSLLSNGSITPGGTSVLLLERFTRAALPTPGNPGRLALLTDYDRGVWKDTGTRWVSLEGEFFNVKQFDAAGDGIVDDRSSIAACIAAAPTGATILFPFGTYRVSAGVSECILVNKNLRILGGHPLATVIVVDAAVGAAVDVIRVAPVGGGDNFEFFEMQNIRLAAASGTPARHGLNLDTSAAGAFMDRIYIAHCYISRFGGDGIHGTNPANSGIFTSVIERCTIYRGINLQRAGDSVTIQDCSMPSSGGVPSIRLSMVVGAQLVSIQRCNSTSEGGIFIDGPARKLVLRDNNMETLVGYAGPGAALVDLAGAVGSEIFDAEVRGNLFQVIAPAFGDVFRADRVTNLDFDDNKIRQDNAGNSGVVITANVVKAQIGRKNRFDLAAGTFDYTIAAGADVTFDSAPLHYTEVVSSAVIASTAVQTAFSKTFTLPANTIRKGDILRVRARGQHAVAAATGATVTIRVNAVNVGPFIIAAGLVAGPWDAQIDMPVWVGGAGGVVQRGFAMAELGGIYAAQLTIGAFALDCTVAQVVDVTWQFTVANPGNTAQMDALTVEVVKGGQTS